MKFLYENEGRYVCECESCGMLIKIKKNDITINNNIGTVEDIECFCGEISNQIDNIPQESQSQIIIQTVERPSSNVPHCPTCGSTNVERISIGSKAIGGYMFGLFSSNIRNTYRCKNCKYKW